MSRFGRITSLERSSGIAGTRHAGGGGTETTTASRFRGRKGEPRKLHRRLRPISRRRFGEMPRRSPASRHAVPVTSGSTSINLPRRRPTRPASAVPADGARADGEGRSRNWKPEREADRLAGILANGAWLAYLPSLPRCRHEVVGAFHAVGRRARGGLRFLCVLIASVFFSLARRAPRTGARLGAASCARRRRVFRVRPPSLQQRGAQDIRRHRCSSRQRRAGFVGLATWFFLGGPPRRVLDRPRPRARGLRVHCLRGCLRPKRRASRRRGWRHVRSRCGGIWAAYMVTTERVRIGMDTLTFNTVALAPAFSRSLPCVSRLACRSPAIRHAPGRAPRARARLASRGLLRARLALVTCRRPSRRSRSCRKCRSRPCSPPRSSASRCPARNGPAEL